MIGLRVLAVFALLLPLAACAGFTLAKGGEKLDLGQGISVRPDRDWNRITVGKFEYWTLDGLRLQNACKARTTSCKNARARVRGLRHDRRRSRRYRPPLARRLPYR